MENKTTVKLYSQRGVVLFLALIALLVMSLAAVALIRSVDTSIIISGNLTDKQLATNSGDAGLEASLTWLGNVADLTTLDSNDAANGYYATQALDPTDPNDIQWDNADSKPASDLAGTIDVNGKDASGNTVRYIIQRMCQNEAPPSEVHCLLGAPAISTSSAGVKDTTQAGAQTDLSQSPVFRITARVVGAKNTISYLQAFAY